MNARQTSETLAETGQPLSSQRGFWSLIVTQFQGAFSDNALKNLVVFLVVVGLSQSERHRVGELVGALFSLPFILFSMYGGFLADRCSKRSVTIAVKVFEVLVMLATLGFFLVEHKSLLLVSVFLMGTHSAFFGPSKYGLLPEILPEKRLSWGNGILELGTFTAIILGTFAGAVMAEHLRGRHVWSGVILVVLALLGLLVSLGITRVPAVAPQKRFRINTFSELWEQLRLVRRDRPLYLAFLGNTYFNFLGALFLLNTFYYGLDLLRITETHIGILNVALALGIGVGSFAAGYLSGGKIEYGLVPLGAVGMTACSIALAPAGLGFTEVLVRLAGLGFFGGFFIVPICALLQHRPDKDKKGSVLAAANLLSFVGVFLASGAHFVLTGFNLDPARIFLIGGIMTLAATAYLLWLLPDALIRLLLWMLTHSFYRIRIHGRDHIPARGGALFVCNHLSFVDALHLLASTDRFVRFIMFKGIYDLPWLKPFARILGVIPISSQVRPREMLHALETAADAIRRGEVVCIFAEGQITRIGQMLPFRRGFERIMKGLEAPIIPVCLDGVWGSIFSFQRRHFSWRLPRRFPQPVSVCYGPPLPPSATAVEVRQAVQDLQTRAWELRRRLMQPLQRSFVQTARRFPFRFAMADSSGRRLRFGAALTGAVLMARLLRPRWQGQRKVGLLLPPSIGGALANFAALLTGRVPVNLNYTASEEAIASCCQQCGIQTIVSSRLFLDRVRLKLPGQVVLLEELLPAVRSWDRVLALLLAWTLPVRWLEKSLGCETAPRLDDLATIIFSSGSTGQPKGVMLSHFNIAANVEQIGRVFAFMPQDRLLGILPFFHSFGFTGTLALPATNGFGVVYHPSPLDARAIGTLVRRHAATFLVATPTFLQMYIRGCEPQDFGSLQFVVTGAEKLPDRVATAFEERFGIRPLEAYGCTECAPAVAMNTPDYRAPGFMQVGVKRGTIGHPLPGIGVRIVSPESFQPLPPGQPGLLLVRGPNIMQGYLGRPDLTAEALRDGWYVTGDIAAQDEDGFLQITDRLSRFSKIGGEMVPHVKIEDKLHELAGVTDQSFVVAGVPDEKKGERLIVLHRLPDDQLQQCLDRLARADLPNLWVPRASQFYRVAEFPYLGTGKLDLRKVRDTALRLSSSAPA